MRCTILIVDDSKLARMSVVRTLKALQPEWTRLEASGFDEALQLSDATPPDLAVVDFNMPGRDGLELAAELRRRHPAVLVAVISANHQQEVVDRATALDAHFLAKPLTEAAMADFLTIAASTMPRNPT